MAAGSATSVAKMASMAITTAVMVVIEQLASMVVF